MKMRRVYHPTADTFKDVPEGDVEKWAKAGWLKGKPKHKVDESERPEVGSWSPVDVPVEPVTAAPVQEAKRAEPAKADTK